MTEKESVNKKILCNLEEFIEFKSLFEMLSDTGLNEEITKLNPKIFLVQDTIGSEFLQFFHQEISDKFTVQEIDCTQKKLEKQIDEIARAFDQGVEEGKEETEDEKDKEPEEKIAPLSLQKKIIFLNNPNFYQHEEKERVIQVVQFVSSKLEEFPQHFFILRLLNEKAPLELVEQFDFQFKIPYPTKIQRITIFEQLLESLSVHTVDITHLSDLTEDRWNVTDLKRLVDRAFIQWKVLNYAEFKSSLENNEVEDGKEGEEMEEVPQQEPDKYLNGIPKIPLTAEIFANLIKRNTIRPLGMFNSYKKPISEQNYVISESKSDHPSQFKPKGTQSLGNTMEGLGLMEIDSFTSSQLYQYAAANKFEELTSTLEKLDQGKKLDEADRRILADYAFILKDPPNRALLKLTNARKTIDRIQKISER